ncbi:CGNR zinc finger domain-containing protein [Micromonospora sp. NPDC050276]|uniref:CGNR zinc finger domain-containing protein n=1 Tax=Micromonospora sp. NPDC050276 TaxID=3364278 RepID=UPI0037AF9664
MTPSIPDHAAAVAMSPWLATARYHLDPAPGGLGLVQDLLNTISAGVPRQPDLLNDLDSAAEWAQQAVAQWSAATGRPAPDVTLDPAGLRELRIFRDELLDEIEARLHATPESGQPATGTATQALTGSRTAGATLRLDEDGSVQLEPAGAGAELLVSLVLAALFEAQLADVARRIKTCRNPRCRVAFYDRSRNNSGVWHSVRVCGHPTNLRAHRARQRQAD